MRVFRWISQRFKDLLYDATNEHLDNGRVIAFVSVVSLIGSASWNMHLHKEIDLSAFGTGLATVLTALVVYVYHDRKTNDSK